MDVDGWAAIEAEIAQIVAASDEPFSPETLAQVSDFLKFIRGCCPVPEVGKGYWSTVRFMWDRNWPGPDEVEVFGDHIEIYRFFDRRSEIRHVDHIPGQPFPPDFLTSRPGAQP
jgi:hypothetical protein